MSKNVEIEKKFLVDADSFVTAASQEGFDSKVIKQGYWGAERLPKAFAKMLSYMSESIPFLDYKEIDEMGPENLEARVRQSDDVFFITFKGKTTLAAGGVKEFEYRTTPCFGERLLSEAEFSISKIRHIVPLSKELKIEVDVFDNLDGLILAEIEIPYIHAEIPKLPSWMGLEVTGNPLYHNRNLAEKGWLKTGTKEVSKPPKP